MGNQKVEKEFAKKQAPSKVSLNIDQNEFEALNAEDEQQLRSVANANEAADKKQAGNQQQALTAATDDFDKLFGVSQTAQRSVAPPTPQTSAPVNTNAQTTGQNTNAATQTGQANAPASTKKIDLTALKAAKIEETPEQKLDKKAVEFGMSFGKQIGETKGAKKPEKATADGADYTKKEDFYVIADAASGAKPSNPEQLTALLAAKYFRPKFEIGYNAGFNKGYAMGQGILFQEAAAKKKAEEEKNKTELYKDVFEDAKSIAAAAASPDKTVSTPAREAFHAKLSAYNTQDPKKGVLFSQWYNQEYAKGVNAASASMQETKANKIKEKLEKNPAFKKGYDAGKSAIAKVVNPATPDDKAQGEKALNDAVAAGGDEQEGFMLAYNQGYAAQAKAVVDKRKAEGDKKTTEGNTGEYYKKGQGVAAQIAEAQAAKNATAEQAAHANREKVLAEIDNHPKLTAEEKTDCKGFFYKGYNGNYGKAATAAAAAANPKNSPAYKRGAGLGKTLGTLVGKAGSEAAFDDVLKDNGKLPDGQLLIDPAKLAAAGVKGTLTFKSIVDYFKFTDADDAELTKLKNLENPASAEAQAQTAEDKKKMEAAVASRTMEAAEAEIRKRNAARKTRIAELEAAKKGETDPNPNSSIQRFNAGFASTYQAQLQKSSAAKIQSASTAEQADPDFVAGMAAGEEAAAVVIPSQRNSGEASAEAKAALQAQIQAVMEQARGQGEKFYGGFLKAFNSKYAEFAGEEGAVAMREKLKNAKTEDGSFTKLTEKYASEKELVAKMNEDFDKVFEETYKAQYDAYKAIGEKKEVGKEGGGSAPLTVPTLSDVQSTYQSKKAEAVSAVEAYYANVMENATAENTQKYTKEKNDLMRAFKLGYWKGYESGKKAGFAFYAGFLETIKEMGAFANAPEKLASFEASKAAIAKEFADFKYAEEADYAEGAKKAADYELGIKTANSLKAQGLEVPDTLLLPNLEIVSKSVADGRKFGTLLWKNHYLLIRGLPTMETEAGDATKEVAPIAEHIPTDKATAEKLVTQDLKKMYSDKYVYFQMKALADAKAAANVSPVIKRAQDNVKSLLSRYLATTKKTTETTEATEKQPVAATVSLTEITNSVNLLLKVQFTDRLLIDAYEKALVSYSNEPANETKLGEFNKKLTDLVNNKAETVEIDTNVAIKPEALAVQKAKLAEKEQEAVEQDRKDFEIGYLEALEQAKTGKDADGKNTDDEAVEKIAENLGYMSGFVAKLAELGATGDYNKSKTLIADFVTNLRDDIFYDKEHWEKRFKIVNTSAEEMGSLGDLIDNFKLPEKNAEVEKSPLYKKALEKGFAEGQTDGFTSYQIYAVGNSKLKTDVKMEKEESSDPFVTTYFKTHAKDFEAILKNVSDNNLVNYWKTKFTMFKDAKTSQELADNSAFKMQVNKEFFKDKLTPAQEKETADPKKAKAQPFLEFDMEKAVYKGDSAKFILNYSEMPAQTVQFEKAGSEFKTFSIGSAAQKDSAEGAIQILSNGGESALYLSGAGIELSKNPPQNTMLFKSALKIPKTDTSFYPKFKAIGIDEKKVEESLLMGDSAGRLSLTDKDYKKSLREVQNKLIKLANAGGNGTKIENVSVGAEVKEPAAKIESGTVTSTNIPNPTPPDLGEF